MSKGRGRAMRDMKYLEEKRLKVLDEIKPICEAFAITDYDYEINDDMYTEVLKIGDIKIGCADNSISAVVDELIGYIFITRWCRNRSLGTFGTQTKNVIKRNWIKRVGE